MAQVWLSIPGWWGPPTPLKNVTSSVGMIIPTVWKNKKCSKPPKKMMIWGYQHFRKLDDSWFSESHQFRHPPNETRRGALVVNAARRLKNGTTT